MKRRVETWRERRNRIEGWKRRFAWLPTPVQESISGPRWIVWLGWYERRRVWDDSADVPREAFRFWDSFDPMLYPVPKGLHGGWLRRLPQRGTPIQPPHPWPHVEEGSRR